MSKAAMMFKGYECDFVVGDGMNGNLYLQLWTREEEGPIFLATVDVEVRLEKDQAYIQLFEGNHGIMEALTEAGAIKRVIAQHHLGSREMPLVQLDLEKMGVTR